MAPVESGSKDSTDLCSYSSIGSLSDDRLRQRRIECQPDEYDPIFLNFTREVDQSQYEIFREKENAERVVVQFLFFLTTSVFVFTMNLGGLLNYQLYGDLYFYTALGELFVLSILMLILLNRFGFLVEKTKSRSLQVILLDVYIISSAFINGMMLVCRMNFGSCKKIPDFKWYHTVYCNDVAEAKGVPVSGLIANLLFLFLNQILFMGSRWLLVAISYVITIFFIVWSFIMSDEEIRIPRLCSVVLLLGPYLYVLYQYELTILNRFIFNHHIDKVVDREVKKRIYTSEGHDYTEIEGRGRGGSRDRPRNSFDLKSLEYRETDSVSSITESTFTDLDDKVTHSLPNENENVGTFGTFGGLAIEKDGLPVNGDSFHPSGSGGGGGGVCGCGGGKPLDFFELQSKEAFKQELDDSSHRSVQSHDRLDAAQMSYFRHLGEWVGKKLEMNQKKEKNY